MLSGWLLISETPGPQSRAPGYLLAVRPNAWCGFMTSPQVQVGMWFPLVLNVNKNGCWLLLECWSMAEGGKSDKVGYERQNTDDVEDLPLKIPVSQSSLCVDLWFQKRRTTLCLPGPHSLWALPVSDMHVPDYWVLHYDLWTPILLQMHRGVGWQEVCYGVRGWGLCCDYHYPPPSPTHAHTSVMSAQCVRTP